MLEARWPGEWRPAREGDVLAPLLAGHACWRLDAPAGDHAHPTVKFLWLGIDGDFPLSRIRVVAPGADGPDAPAWPHVEDGGALCLRALPLDVERHVRLAVDDAFDILGMQEDGRDAEFSREFVSYWGRRTGSIPEARSLVVPGGQARPIVWAPFGKSFIFAEDKTTLAAWFSKSGLKAGGIHRTRLVRIDPAPSPDQYPATGADVFALDPPLRDLCERRTTMPVLVDVQTPSGPVQVALAIVPRDVPGMDKNKVHPVSAARRDTVFGKAPVTLVPLMRQDHAWVHGRDHNKDAAVLAGKAVGVIGCGALGSEVVRLLAAAGAGQFVLVDKDYLESANTTRHALGAGSVGLSKATALSQHLGRMFPHQDTAVAHDQPFENLAGAALDELAHCSLVIAAGVDALAIVRIARWRDGLEDPPPLLIAWTEEFACAGHAMLVAPGLTPDTFLDPQGRPVSNLTSKWPQDAGVTVAPAGCGSAFQPYTATDMLGTVQVTTRLALEVLLGDIDAPVHRVWLGDRGVAEKGGATLSPAFDGSHREKELP